MEFTILKIQSGVGGSHERQTYPGPITVMEGWAHLPQSLGTPETLEHFPFGAITVENVESLPTVTSWTPLPVPEPEPLPDSEPTPEEQNARLRAQVAMLQEQQTFLENCLLEMAEEVYA